MKEPDAQAGNDTGDSRPAPLAEVAARLVRALGANLPGPAAQAPLSPRRPDGTSLHGGRQPREAPLPAAGLVILYPREGEPYLLLTVRAADLPAHPGQIGLPGGMQDPGESLRETALRETREEVGVAEADLEVLGTLTPVFIPPTGILLHPFVAVATAPLGFEPHAAEVQRLLEVPLRTLLDPSAIRSEPRTLAAGEATIPYFELGGEKVWGATAMVLSELRAILTAPASPDEAA